MPKALIFLLGYVGAVGVKNSIKILMRAGSDPGLILYGAAGLLVALGNLYLTYSLYRNELRPAVGRAVLISGLAYLCVILVMHLRAGRTTFALIHFLGGVTLNLALLRRLP